MATSCGRPRHLSLMEAKQKQQEVAMKAMEEKWHPQIPPDGGGKVKELCNQHVSGFWIDSDFFSMFSQFFYTNFHHPAFWKCFYILTSFLWQFLFQTPISTAGGCVASWSPPP